MLARVRSGALYGIDAVVVDVEVDMSMGMPFFNVVGLPEGAVKESKVRVISALKNRVTYPRTGYVACAKPKARSYWIPALLAPLVLAALYGPRQMVMPLTGLAGAIIAIAVAPLALVTLRRALRGRFAKHRQIARITVPLWIYTAVTGWAVYWMLFHA